MATAEEIFLLLFSLFVFFVNKTRSKRRKQVKRDDVTRRTKFERDQLFYRVFAMHNFWFYFCTKMNARASGKQHSFWIVRQLVFIYFFRFCWHFAGFVCIRKVFNFSLCSFRVCLLSYFVRCCYCTLSNKISLYFFRRS